MGYTLDGRVDGMVTRTLSTHGRSNITSMSFQLGRSWAWVGSSVLLVVSSFNNSPTVYNHIYHSNTFLCCCCCSLVVSLISLLSGGEI